MTQLITNVGGLHAPVLTELYPRARYPQLLRGLVGAWVPALGNQGSKLIDVSGRGNHGTLTNMDPQTDWVSTDRGMALDFDGSNDYISLPNTMSTGDCTAITWWTFSLTLTAGHYSHIIGWGSALSYPADIGKNFMVLFGSDVNFGGITTFGCSQYGDAFGTGSGWNDGRIHQGVIVKSGSTYYGFVDGVLRNSKTMTTNTTATNGFIGRSLYSGSLGSNSNWGGKIYDILVYNRILSPQEIALDYSLGPAGWLARRSTTYSFPSTATPWIYSRQRSRIIGGGVS